MRFLYLLLLLGQTLFFNAGWGMEEAAEEDAADPFSLSLSRIPSRTFSRRGSEGSTGWEAVAEILATLPLSRRGSEGSTGWEEVAGAGTGAGAPVSRGSTPVDNSLSSIDTLEFRDYLEGGPLPLSRRASDTSDAFACPLFPWADPDDTHNATGATLDDSQRQYPLTTFQKQKKRLFLELEINPEDSVLGSSDTVLGTELDRQQLGEASAKQGTEGDNPYASVEWDGEEISAVILPPKRILELRSTSNKKPSEAILLENLHTHTYLASLIYNSILIGPYLSLTQKRLLDGVRTVSKTMFAGDPKKAGGLTNIGAFKLQFLLKDGLWSSLSSSLSDFLFFPSNEGGVASNSPPLASIPGRATLTSTDLGGEIGRLKQNQFFSHSLGEYGVKASDEFPPLMHSDADSKKISQKDAVIWSITKIFNAFPETTIGILRKIICSDTTEKEEVFLRALSKGIHSVIDLLDSNQIGKIFGHSEQIMARFFENHLLPLVEAEQERRKASGHSLVHEIFVHASSLQDCCSLCGRLWTALSGPRMIAETLVNVRVIMSTGKSYSTHHFSSPTANPESKESRASDVLRVHSPDLDLAMLPNILFDFAAEAGASAGGAGAGSTS